MDVDDSQYVKFVSQKIQKIRWRPMHSSLQKPDVFITGSWDDVKNSINLWTVQGGTDFNDGDLESDRLKCVHKCFVPGDVGDMCFRDPESIVVGLGNGEVLLFKYDIGFQRLSIAQSWPRSHHTSGVSSPCTGVDVCGPDVVTVGEDGSMNLLRIGSDRPLRNLSHADSTPITGVQFLVSNEICTVNKMGQLRVWDTRSSKDEPTRIIVSSEDLCALESLDRHPARPHVLATGGADGCVTTFDIRKENAPLTKLEVHGMEVWEVHFHPTSPDNLFTCSEDGTVRKMDVTSEFMNREVGSGSRPPVDVTELLACHGIAVNSLSVVGSRLACGTDLESIYIVENVL